MATVRGNPTEWDRFYKTVRWQRLRKLQLRAHPLCKFCLERGIVTAANVVDHVTPHRGDWNKFVLGELQSLCEPCHNAAKRKIEFCPIAHLRRDARCRCARRADLLQRLSLQSTRRASKPTNGPPSCLHEDRRDFRT